MGYKEWYNKADLNILTITEILLIENMTKPSIVL